MCTSSINYESRELSIDIFESEDVSWVRKKLKDFRMAIVCSLGRTSNLCLVGYPDKILIDYTGRFNSEEQLCSYMRRHWEETLKEISKSLENE